MSEPIMQKLDEMQARCDAATEGPWESDGGEVAQHWSLPEPWKQVVSGDVDCMSCCYGGRCYPVKEDADAEFIASARTDMPRLIAALKKIARHASQDPCYCLEGDRPDPEGCYCSGDGHGPTSCADCLTHELHEIITEALGVDDA